MAELHIARSSTRTRELSRNAPPHTITGAAAAKKKKKKQVSEQHLKKLCLLYMLQYTRTVELQYRALQYSSSYDRALPVRLYSRALFRMYYHNTHPSFSCVQVPTRASNEVSPETRKHPRRWAPASRHPATAPFQRGQGHLPRCRCWALWSNSRVMIM